jgi:hypothetical protein
VSRTLAAAALLALVLAGAAAADNWQIHRTAAGNAAAAAIVLKRSDLGPSGGWTGGPVKPSLSSTPPCAGFRPKQSDLVLVGAAESRWSNAGVQLDSSANVLQSPHMVALDWQRTVLASPVVPCLRQALAKELRSTGTLVSFARRSFPAVTSMTRAYRGIVKVSNSVRVSIDLIVLGKLNSELTLTVIAPTAADATLQPAELRLARLLASRIRTM